MPTPRTPAPSRIGKTLGAILSTPRRGAAEVDEAADVEETVDKPDHPSSDSARPAVAARSTISETPPAAPFTTGVAPAHQPTHGPAVDAHAALSEPPAAIVASPTAVASPAVEHDSTEERGGGGTRRKKRETFLIPDDLADAMRNAIVHLSGPPLYYTLAEFGEHAIRNYIAELERDHNAGQPFPPRPRAVQTRSTITMNGGK